MPVAFADLAQSCAPTVQIETLAAMVSLESGFAPFAIRINSGAPLREPPNSKAEAIELATTLIADRQDVDLGLGGINADDLGRLELTVTDAFDPCLNLKATARLLDRYYRVAIGGGASPAEAATVMLKAYYGRGDASVGEMAAFASQVHDEAKRLAPKLASLTIGAAGPSTTRDRAGERSAQPPPAAAPPAARSEARPAHWDVFATARKSSALVFQNEQSE